MKVLVQHPERRTTQVIVVSSPAGFVTAIQPAQCAEIEVSDDAPLTLSVVEGATIEAPALNSELPDLTPEDEQRLADEFADFDRVDG